MEVARLESVYTANISDLERKSAQADSRLKHTATEAKKTEQAVTQAFSRDRLSGDPLGRLRAEFSARSTRLRNDLNDLHIKSSALKAPLRQLELQASNTGLAIRRDLDGALSILSPRLASVFGAVGPLTAGILGLGAVVAGGAGLFSLAKHAADAGDEIFDLTQKVNFAAETISTLKNEGQLADVEFGAISSSLGIFNKNVEASQSGNKKLANTFKSLKIDLTNNETALRSTFRALMAVEDEGQQVALAMQIFGKSGKEVLGVIKSLNGDIDAATNKFRAMGTLITTESARAANEFSDKLTLLQQKFDAVARAVGERFMPTISSAMDQVNAALDKNKATAQNWATDLVAIVEFAATQIGHILKGAALVIEGFRKTFGKGSLFERVTDVEQSPIRRGIREGLRKRGWNIPEPGAPPQRWDVEGEFAIAGGAGEFSIGAGPGGAKKRGSRIDIQGGGGGSGGRSAQRDVLESLRNTLINLNAEWRKWDVALLDSAASSALAAQKQTLLDNVVSSLSTKTKLAIAQVRNIDEALDKAVSSLPQKSQASARALITESLAQFKLNEERRIAGELTKQSEDLLQGWRLEVDNSRGGADRYTLAIQNLEKAYSKYGLTLDAGTKKELEQVAALQRAIEKTKELTRVRVIGDRPRRFNNNAPGDVIDLGRGSFFMEGGTGFERERIATVGQTVLREREQMRIQEMREVAQDLGSIFGDAFDSIRGDWKNLWQDMASIARNISRQFIQELFTGMFSKAFNVPFSTQSGGIVGSLVNRIFGAGQSPIDLGGGSTFSAGGTGATRPRVAGARALGGPVDAGRLYEIHDREYFMPNIGGKVLTFDQHEQMQKRQQGPIDYREPWRVAFVDDIRQAREWRANEVHRVRKQTRKIGKLIPGF